MEVATMSRSVYPELPFYRVFLFDTSVERAALLEGIMGEMGMNVKVKITGMPVFGAESEQADSPALYVVGADSLSEPLLQHLQEALCANLVPVVLVTGDADSSSIQQAIHIGVSACIVGGGLEFRLPSVLTIAHARFNEMQALRGELAEANARLKERKVVEKAKGILMAKKNMTEEAAYSTLRNMAMEKNVRMGVVAEQVIALADLLA